MSEKLVIKNFGPIKDMSFDFKKINILIGEQATGKSTVAKLLAMCRYFSYIINGEIREGLSNFSEGLISWGLNEFLKKDSYIYYECKHYALTVKQETTRVRQGFPDENGEYKKYNLAFFNTGLKSISEDFKNLLIEYNNLFKKSRTTYNRPIPPSFFENNVAAVLDNPLYLPAERGLQSIFSLGKSSIQNISDSQFNQFAKIDGILRGFKKDVKIEPLKIVYRNKDGDSFIKSSKHKYISLATAATGYQSTIPIILSIKYYAELRKKKKTFIIEEPEENLFPIAQYELIKFFVENIKYNNAILLTTHSPYILTSLNNLIYAYQVGKSKNDKTKKIIEEKYWLNPDEVSAYMLGTNGKREDIFNKKEAMIKAEKIDDVSRKLNGEFDLIQNVELGLNEKK
jgi:predicted ATP-dependent endonuclease of OLD family